MYTSLQYKVCCVFIASSLPSVGLKVAPLSPSLSYPVFSNKEGRKSGRRRTSEEDAGGFWAGFCGEVKGAETGVGCVRVCE